MSKISTYSYVLLLAHNRSHKFQGVVIKWLNIDRGWIPVHLEPDTADAATNSVISRGNSGMTVWQWVSRFSYSGLCDWPLICGLLEYVLVHYHNHSSNNSIICNTFTDGWYNNKNVSLHFHYYTLTIEWNLIHLYDKLGFF